jgi:Cu+-exporting ATPase
MSVDPARAAASSDYQGKTFYFCCSSCRERFQANPGQYLDKISPQSASVKIAPAQASPKANLEYVCPMDPEVISDRPGSCPKCGMALEPRTISLEERPSPELADMSRRFWLSVGLGIPLLLLHMGGMVAGQAWHEAETRWLAWIQVGLATPIVFWCGWPFFERAWRSLLARSLNMFTLIAAGVGTAYLYSVAGVVWADRFPEGFRNVHGNVELYFETAAMITILVLLGQVLEQRARSRTSSAIRKLLGLAPKTARLVGPHGHETDVPIELVQKGDLLRIRPGEKVPVDGVVLEGRSAIDESMFSGEPVPVEKVTGSKVIGGTLNGTGGMLVRAERVGTGTLLAQIVQLVGEAQRSRAPVQRLVDHVAAYFMPAVLAVSVLTFAGWSLVGGEARFAHALVSAIAVLIIACPCALGLATPMAIMVGTGRGAESGVLIRDAQALEALHKADTLVVDKTGTLTEGRPRVIAVEALPRHSADEMLRVAASLERASEHPLAAALVEEAKARGLTLVEASNFQTYPGRGVEGQVLGRQVLVGNPVLFAERKLSIATLQPRLEGRSNEAETVMLIAVDGEVAGLVSVADTLKPTTPEAVRLLHSDGMRILMLSGDSQATAESVGRMAGIDTAMGEMLPADKSAAVKRLQDEGHTVAMAGDGINDAPALAQADIGIAMGTGTDVAMETAGITLVQGDLRAIARARNLSRATIRNIRQNLFLAFIYNVVSIPAAALGILHPIWAAAAMSLSSLSVVGNALRLRRIRI